MDIRREAAALNVLKDDLAGQGIGWMDMPIAGGGGENAMTVLAARVTATMPLQQYRCWASQSKIGLNRARCLT